MVTLYKLSPEVAGRWGPHTTVTNSAELCVGQARLPEIAHLEYLFDGWLGDELLESAPCFVVTADLEQDMLRSALSGAVFEDVEISVSEEFTELFPDVTLPEFRRLLPGGKVLANSSGSLTWSGHDVCVNERGDLVVTEACLAVLQTHRLDNCDIETLEVEG